jgi:hypothetical protein
VDSSNTPQADSALTNSGAGIRVWGSTLGNESDKEDDAEEKSITWQYGSGSGMTSLTGNLADADPFWEIKGGAMRLSYVRPDDKTTISFAFRINSSEELEFVKIDSKDNSAKRIAKFGMTRL